MVGSAGTHDVNPGENTPAMPINTLGNVVYYYTSDGSNASWFKMQGNYFYIGKELSNSAFPLFANFVPEELWGIDKKIDDGLPNYGALITTKNGSNYTSNCLTDDTSSAQYDLTQRSEQCSIILKAD